MNSDRLVGIRQVKTKDVENPRLKGICVILECKEPGIIKSAGWRENGGGKD